MNQSQAFTLLSAHIRYVFFPRNFDAKATGKKSLFVSPNFASHIVGFKKEESDVLLNFLNLHVSLGIDFQGRVRWEPGTVAVFDNRTVLQLVPKRHAQLILAHRCWISSLRRDVMSSGSLRRRRCLLRRLKCNKLLIRMYFSVI